MSKQQSNEPYDFQWLYYLLISYLKLDGEALLFSSKESANGQ